MLKESRSFAQRRRTTLKRHDEVVVVLHAFSPLALEEGEC